MLFGFFSFLFISIATYAQDKKWISEFDNIYFEKAPNYPQYRTIFLKKSLSGSSYDFMHLSYCVDALAKMYKLTGDSRFFNDEKAIIDNVLKSAIETKDHYKGWIASQPLHPSTLGKEVFLFEGYLFRYILEFLNILKKDKWSEDSVENEKWFSETVAFIENNVWRKWTARSVKSKGNPIEMFLYNRTDQSSLWAMIALELDKVSSDILIKQQAKLLYLTFDNKMHMNIRVSTIDSSAVVWNSTWDHRSDSTVIQDVAHGNQVVAYIIAAIELGNKNWNESDCIKICNTVKKILLKKQGYTFYDNMDRTPLPEREGSGNFISDGWVKLGRCDRELQNDYIMFIQKNQSIVYEYLQAPQLYAQIAYNEFILNKK